MIYKYANTFSSRGVCVCVSGAAFSDTQGSRPQTLVHVLTPGRAAGSSHQWEAVLGHTSTDQKPVQISKRTSNVSSVALDLHGRSDIQIYPELLTLA